MFLMVQGHDYPDTLVLYDHGAVIPRVVSASQLHSEAVIVQCHSLLQHAICQVATCGILPAANDAGNCAMSGSWSCLSVSLS